MVSRKSVARLSLYRRLLLPLQEAGAGHIYSHQLARLAGVSAAQVRRDLMAVGYSGSPNRGYEVDNCLGAIAAFLDGEERQDVALVGAGRLGRSVLAHFSSRPSMLRFAVCFDTDPALIDTSIEGVRCHSIEVMEQVVRDLGITVGVIAVPADMAQAVAADLVRGGVRSLISFSPVPLRVPDDVFVDYLDITSALESAAFYARHRHNGRRKRASGEPSTASSGLDAVMRQIAPLLSKSNMTLEELADRIGAQIITPGRPDGTPVKTVYAGDRVSDLLNEAAEGTLLVSNLASVQLVRVAELMDVPGICFVDGVTPHEDIIELARVNRTLLMTSPVGVFETCGRIYEILGGRT